MTITVETRRVSTVESHVIRGGDRDARRAKAREIAESVDADRFLGATVLSANGEEFVEVMMRAEATS